MRIAVFRERHGHAGQRLERLEHGAERTGRDVEGAWLRLRLHRRWLAGQARRTRDSVLPEEERERFARRPDLDMGERGFEPPRFERDAAFDRQRELTVIGGVQRGDGADDGADDDEGGLRARARRLSLLSFHDSASARWRVMTASARMPLPDASRATRVIRVGPDLRSVRPPGVRAPGGHLLVVRAVALGRSRWRRPTPRPNRSVAGPK